MASSPSSADADAARKDDDAAHNVADFGSGLRRRGSQSQTWQAVSRFNVYASPRPESLDSGVDPSLLVHQRTMSRILLILWLAVCASFISTYAVREYSSLESAYNPSLADVRRLLAAGLAPSCPCSGSIEFDAVARFHWHDDFDSSTNICVVARSLYAEQPLDNLNFETEFVGSTVRVCSFLDSIAAAAVNSIRSYGGVGVSVLAPEQELLRAMSVVSSRLAKSTPTQSQTRSFPPLWATTRWRTFQSAGDRGLFTCLTFSMIGL